jgi:hypothetical protein
MQIFQKLFIGWLFLLVAFASILLCLGSTDSLSATSEESFSETFGPYINQLFSYFSS